MAMSALLRWQLVLGLVLSGFVGAVQNAAAHSLGTQASFTVHIRNHAEVDSKQLAEAERVAAAIFRKAGVASCWVEADDVSESQNSDLVDQNGTSLSHVYVSILSQSLAQFHLSKNAMGLAPGSGPNRNFAYVFYDRVKELALKQVTARLNGTISAHATASQILGGVIAHEIGHILLNLPSHSNIGIMRGDWDLNTLQYVAYGSLLFTMQQAEIIREEVVRRGN
jgi:hypothetical protein